MARFLPPSIERPTGGEFGDAVPGAVGVDQGSYHARKWFGTKKNTPYEYEVYAMLGHVQVWVSNNAIAKVKPLSNSDEATAIMAGLDKFLGRDGFDGLRSEGERQGMQVVRLRTEKHLATKTTPSLRRNIWTAAHRVAATCLVGIEDMGHDLVPMEEASSLAYRARRDADDFDAEVWMAWWSSLSVWARVWLYWACRMRIVEMLDNRDGHERDVPWWLGHFATWHWQGRKHGHTLRPAAGGTRRSCFSVLLSQWIHPRSNVTAKAMELLERANANRASMSVNGLLQAHQWISDEKW